MDHRGHGQRLSQALERPACANLVASIVIFIVAFVSVWQLLKQAAIPDTPAKDLAKHIASAINFRAAINDGQWLPRLQIASPYLADIPLFQFYGSFLGLISLPHLAAGLKPMTAVCLAILGLKWIGACSLFHCVRLLGTSFWAALLSSISYLLSPYVISTFYGRVALPEVTAHCLLPILFYGLVRIALRPDKWAIVIVALSVVGLSLAHPIFLLYGVCAAGLFLLSLAQMRPLVLGLYGLLAGMLLASFQWLPALVAGVDIPIDLSRTPFGIAYATSAAGLWGMPQSLSGAYGEDHLYLTPGILTLPVLGLLIWNIRRPVPRALSVCLLVFLLGSLPPIDFWQYLPKQFFALQFPYRLLAFVALFVAIGIGTASHWIRLTQFAILAVIVVVQASQILQQEPYSVRTPSEPDYVALNYASYDYASIPVYLPFLATDKWMLHYASEIHSDSSKLEGVIDKEGRIVPGNSFNLVLVSFPENYLRISGVKRQAASTKLALTEVSASAPSASETLPEGEFSILFSNPNNAGRLALTCIEPDSDCAGVTVTSIDTFPSNGIQVAANNGGINLKLEGTTAVNTEPVDLWFARPGASDEPVTPKVRLGPGAFENTLTLPRAAGVYMLVTSWSVMSGGPRRLSLSIDYFSFEDAEGPVQISPTKVMRTKSGGYSRIFRIQPLTNADAITRRGAVIDLPMAFSSLFRATQGDVVLLTSPSRQGRLQVHTRDVVTPIHVQFSPPAMALYGPLFGLLMLAIGPFLLRFNRPCPRNIPEMS